MSNHSNIIRSIGHAELAKLCGVSIHTARSWEQRNSLPAKYWKAIIEAGHCSADELICAAARAA